MADRELAFSGDSLTDEQLRSLERNREVEQLTIWSGPITNDRLAPLSRLTWLTGLVLGEMPIDDGVFPHLKELRELEYLNLAYTNIRGDFSILSGIPLRDVRLEGCRRVGDECAMALAQFPTLRQLEIHMTGVTDRGLESLSGLPLETLWLGPRVTDTGIRAIQQMKSLKHLDICAPGVTDESVRSLRGLETLEVLWLGHCSITDASLDVLCGFRSLRELGVGHTGLTAVGRARIRAALPDCRLVEEGA